MMTAKAIMPGKFWILEDSTGLKKGTLRVGVDGSIDAHLEGQTINYVDWAACAGDLDISIMEEDVEETVNAVFEVHGYPTNTEPFNAMWDMKEKLPLFTKIAKSQSRHAAGYYIIHFEHGWVQSFCPKLVTLKNNEWQGPFKTKIEMREKLRHA